jgi:molybdate transport system substrate-binding protein
MVAVAANAVPVMRELGAEFERQSGVSVVLSSGATGLLARQLREGAPFDLFVSADMVTVRQLAGEALVTTASVAAYARGTLLLWQRADAPVAVRSLDDLKGPAAAKIRIAVANPRTAPYGAAALETLRSTGLADALKDGLVMTENVGQALQYASTGNVDCAFVAKSLVMDRPGTTVQIPESLHAPIIQGLGVVAASKHPKEAAALRAFLLSPPARETLAKHGYRPADGAKQKAF